MSYLYPGFDVLHQSFAPHGAVGRSPHALKPKASRYQARPELYGAYSVVDDAKAKTKQLGAEASKEFEKASAAAKSKAGKLELYSGQYYAACTVGGMLACVRLSFGRYEPACCILHLV
jgi:solute carrier family 25 (mitochondrial phosphate transporter), member 3